MKGQINLGTWVLITAIVAILILLIFDSTIRSYILTNLSGLITGIKSTSPGQLSEVITNFTAYNCSSACSTFSSSIYYWTINFNGQNYTYYLNDSIGVSSSAGNYSLELYPVLTSSGELCSNATTSTQKTKILKVAADKNYNIYYFSC
ncbi:MAG: hypothetical protein M1322_02455 [Candidatus Parvarchaeota archaeon]|nr:hypothetical protein [Candidatus Parvarchaeota archaeon]MCL5106952.1 hypothetical protein [Candidatus Parvarchaeota archaeon]